MNNFQEFQQQYSANTKAYEYATPQMQAEAGTQAVGQAFASLMKKTYLWMALALVITGMTAYGVAHNYSIMETIISNRAIFWILAIAELGLVIGLSAAINKLSLMTASIMFIVYSMLNGVTMSFIFLAYTATSIATTFFVTAGAFAGLALIGFFIKKDLSALGKFFLFALIGIIIASIVNIFVGSSGLDLVISIGGVVVFAGLTAYDTQKIKEMFLATGTEVNEQTQKLAVLGALTLYLDFINLFLYLLRFLGKARD